MNARELKERLTLEDITLFMTKALQSDEPVPQTGAAVFQTVCHNGPHSGSHKLYYYEDTQTFVCFTECGKIGDIYALVQHAGYANDFIDAYQFVCDFFGYNPFGRTIEEEEAPELTADWDLLAKLETISKPAAQKKHDTPILPDSLMEFYTPKLPDIWYQEGISLQVMRDFGIRIDTARERIIIPHYDLKGRLIGIRARSYNQWDLDNGCKYMPVRIEEDWCNHPLGDHLYGLNFSREAIERTKTVVVVEGEKSVLKSKTFYGDNSFTVAACGSNLSETQVNLLLSLGVNEIIIAFDKEHDDFPTSDSTLSYKQKIMDIASQFSPYVNTYIILDTYNKLEYKDSPFDKGQETLEFLLKKKILVPSLSTTSITGKRRNK